MSKSKAAKARGKAEWRTVVNEAKRVLKEKQKQIALLNDIITFEGVPNAKDARKLDKRLCALMADEEPYFVMGDFVAALETPATDDNGNLNF